MTHVAGRLCPQTKQSTKPTGMFAHPLVVDNVSTTNDVKDCFCSCPPPLAALLFLQGKVDVNLSSPGMNLWFELTKEIYNIGQITQI